MGVLGSVRVYELPSNCTKKPKVDKNLIVGERGAEGERNGATDWSELLTKGERFLKQAFNTINSMCVLGYLTSLYAIFLCSNNYLRHQTKNNKKIRD